MYHRKVIRLARLKFVVMDRVLDPSARILFCFEPEPCLISNDGRLAAQSVYSHPVTLNEVA
jgi:hypothetical protein